MANKTDGLEWDFSTSPAAAEHLKRCIDDAREVFDIYMTGPQTGVFEMGQMRRWLAEHPDLSPFFIVALIEHAASRAQKRGLLHREIIDCEIQKCCAASLGDRSLENSL